MFVILFSIILILIDQFSKYLVVTNLAKTDGITIIKDFLQFYYVENRGAAFGILEGHRSFFIIITLIVLAILFYIAFKDYNKKSSILKFTISLLIAGTIGNFIDRIRLHYVVDFISLKILKFNFAVFNLADSFIVIGTILLMIMIILHDNPKVKK